MNRDKAPVPEQAPRPGIVMSGASGEVGRMLLPLLKARGCRLVLAGRDFDRLQAQFPGEDVVSLADLPDALDNIDAVLHLAAISSDSDASPEAYHAANVELPCRLASLVAQSGSTRFIFASSVHALDPAKSSPYANSKREAERRLEGLPHVTILNLATLHDERRACGGLGILNGLPRPLARRLFPVFAALKPTLHAEALAEAVYSAATTTPDPARQSAQRLVLTAGQERNSVYRLFRLLIDVVFCLVVIVGFSWC